MDKDAKWQLYFLLYLPIYAVPWNMDYFHILKPSWKHCEAHTFSVHKAEQWVSKAKTLQ